jgi:long-chain fatty acid transport protein
MRKVIALVSMAILPVTYIAAEGYQVGAQSTKQAGMGHLGASLKLGAESMHFNPAGLGFLDKTIHVSAGVSGVFTSVDYSNGDYKHSADNNPSTPLFLYAGFKIYDNLSAGVSVNNPYGSAMNWGANWKGAALIQDIALKSFSIQPTLAYRITDRLSIGAGLMMMFGDFSLSRALISSEYLADVAKVNPALQPLAAKYKDMTPISANLSGDAGVKLGYNVGAMFDISDYVTVGASFRSKVQMTVPEGKAAVTYANEAELKPILGSQIPPLDAGTFEASLPLPSNLNIGVSYKPSDRFLISGEVQFVGWSAYKELNVQFSQEVLNGYSIKAEKNYHDTRIYRIGGQFAATKRLDLRLGFYVDESPVKTDFLNPETPSMTKLGSTAGLSFRPSDKFSVDLSCQYITGFGRDGSYPLPLPTAPANTFGGRYDVHAFTPSIGLSYAF